MSDDTDRLPGIKAKHAIITPNCRKVQGGDKEAFNEAARRLLDEYLAIIYLRGDKKRANYHLVLTVESIDREST